jgi:hypothetical protein
MVALSPVLPKHLTDWHEGRAAARMLIAALAAYVCTTKLAKHMLGNAVTPPMVTEILKELAAPALSGGGSPRKATELLNDHVSNPQVAAVGTRRRV